MSDNVVQFPGQPGKPPLTREGELGVIREDLAVAHGMLTEAHAAVEQTLGDEPDPLMVAVTYALDATLIARKVAGEDEE